MIPRLKRTDRVSSLDAVSPIPDLMSTVTQTSYGSSERKAFQTNFVCSVALPKPKVFWVTERVTLNIFFTNKLP